MSEQTAGDVPVKSSKGFKRVLKTLDMTLFTVCAVLVIDQLAASASIGVQSIFWWIFTLIFFFIPYGLITAELGSTYPDQGGIYAWVQRAFGGRWGGRTAWFWWINVAFWQPSVYIIFTGMFAQLFMPELGLWPQIAIAIALHGSRLISTRSRLMPANGSPISALSSKSSSFLLWALAASGTQ
jgi:amino acid transporter